jgi:single-strand DNA-binding protein
MNKVMLIGNVGKDPDVRYYEKDQATAQFPLATTERGYTLPNGTQVPEHTDWHNILLGKNLAKIAENYIHNGDKLYIEGRIRYRSYDDQKGQRRYVTEILAENIEFLSPKSSSVSNQDSARAVSDKSQQSATDNKLPF